MKNLTTKMMIAAATLVAAAGVASAQSMEANVPFAFRANGQVFAAGTYRIDLHNTGMGNTIVAIRGAGSGKQILTPSYPDGDAKSAWQSEGKAMLSFECGVSRCALAKVWAGSGAVTLRLPTPKLGKDEPTHTAEVVMHPVKGD
jgi:hypothetical protein